MTNPSIVLPPLHPVESGLIAGLGWIRIPYADESELGVLDVALRTGRRYRYYDVPRSVYLQVRSAKSVGAMFNRLITRAGFPYAILGGS